MGVIKGDLLTESDKLADVSLLASGHYSSFLANSEITDDFGRCRVHGPLLVAKAFTKRLEKGRTDISAKRVMAWFDEYAKVGLLRVYRNDGSLYGEWTNWQGKAPSKRCMHRAPEPPWSDHVHTTTCEKSGKRFSRRLSVAVETASDLAPVPLSPLSPESPVTPNNTKQQPAGPAPLDPRAENPLVDREAQLRDGHRLIPIIASKADLDQTEVLEKVTAFNGRGFVRLDVLWDDRLARAVNHLRRWARELGGEVEPEPPARASPHDEQRGQLSKVVAGMKRAQEIRDAQRKGVDGRLGQAQRLLSRGEQEPEPGRRDGS